jgi:hypothetical protein
MVVLVLVAAGVFCGALWLYLLRDPSKSAAQTKAAWLDSRVRQYREHAQTLQDHSDEYCAVFNNDEWSKLTSTLAKLETFNQEVRCLMSARKYGEAIFIMERVNTLDSISPLQEVDQEIQTIEGLINWERRVHGMLKSAVLNLEVAATNTKDLAKAKVPTAHRPTLVKLADLKKVLLEDEELRQLSSQ